MQDQNLPTIINRQNGELAFRLFTFNDGSHFGQLQRHNFYSIIWIKSGKGFMKVDFSEYDFTENAFCSFVPYQPFLINSTGPVSGIIVQFHSDFFCIHANHTEVGCDGVLFNNIYEKPFFYINSASAKLIDLLINQLKSELYTQALAQNEQIISYLKILLITASRIKTEKLPVQTNLKTDNKEPEILRNLKAAIENNFRQIHSASEYAALLSISANALAKNVKMYYGKTLTQLIAERIILEAKRELYLSGKPIKEIAWALGYADEYHFSRIFKKNTNISPLTYRDTVGFAKAT
jgi:AraC family transcriptional regulator, transcriptional activator of pobA